MQRCNYISQLTTYPDHNTYIWSGYKWYVDISDDCDVNQIRLHVYKQGEKVFLNDERIAHAKYFQKSGKELLALVQSIELKEDI